MFDCFLGAYFEIIGLFWNFRNFFYVKIGYLFDSSEMWCNIAHCRGLYTGEYILYFTYCTKYLYPYTITYVTIFNI